MRIDTRAGSKDYVQPLRDAGIPVEEAILPAGDVEIVGEGPEGRPVLVGVEIKSIEDLAACVRNGRFAEQFRGMKESYEVCWLLVEGRWAGFTREEGISVWRKAKWFHLPARMTYQEIAAWAMTMAQVGGALIWRSETEGETVQWLRSLNLWWTAKEWESHRAHMALYTPPLGAMNPFSTPSLAEYVARDLPHIGSTMAHRVAEHFGSVRRMVNADVEEWTAIRGVGKKVAADLVKALE